MSNNTDKQESILLADGEEEWSILGEGGEERKDSFGIDLPQDLFGSPTTTNTSISSSSSSSSLDPDKKDKRKKGTSLFGTPTKRGTNRKSSNNKGKTKEVEEKAATPKTPHRERAANLAEAKALEVDNPSQDPLREFLMLREEPSSLSSSPTDYGFHVSGKNKSSSASLSSASDDVHFSSSASVSALDTEAQESKTARSADAGEESIAFSQTAEDTEVIHVWNQPTSTAQIKEQQVSSVVERVEEEADATFEEPPTPSLAQMVKEFNTLFIELQRVTEETSEEEKNEKEENEEGQKAIQNAKDATPNLKELLRKKALNGTLSTTVLRGICWKLFLEYFSEASSQPSQWMEEEKQYRQQYDKLSAQYMFDPHKEGEELDPAINNPLSQAEDSPWQQFFQDAELKKQIVLDVERVYPERAFFNQKWVQESMLRILFIYAREHPRILYRQGMHELLAPIVYVLHREQVNSEMANAFQASEPNDDEAKQVLAFLNDSNYMEHSAYFLFSKLMEQTSEWFIYSPATRKPKHDVAEQPFTSMNELEQDAKSSPIIAKCRTIQNNLLRKADPQLQQHLDDNDIEPQLYALRWVRLLLQREFHLEDVLILWDAIFGYGQDLLLLDYVIVAMLMYIRNSLLEGEHSRCLSRLFNYPPVEDVRCFTEKALLLLDPSFAAAIGISAISEKPASSSSRDAVDPLSSDSASTDNEATTLQSSSDKRSSPRSSAPAATTTESTVVVNNNKGSRRGTTDLNPSSKSQQGGSLTAAVAQHQAQRRTKRSNSGTSNSFPSLVKSLLPSGEILTTQKEKTLKAEVLRLQQEAQKTHQTQLHMSNRLERIIYTLQQELLEKGSNSQSQQKEGDENNDEKEGEKEEQEQRTHFMDSVFLALAELKQVKDVLAGNLSVGDYETLLVASSASSSPFSSSSSSTSSSSSSSSSTAEHPHPHPHRLSSVSSSVSPSHSRESTYAHPLE